MAVHRWETEIGKDNSKENISSSGVGSKFMSSQILCRFQFGMWETLGSCGLTHVFISWTNFSLDDWSFFTDETKLSPLCWAEWVSSDNLPLKILVRDGGTFVTITLFFFFF